MRTDLESLLKTAQTLPTEELPEFLGGVEQIRQTAQLRLASRAPSPADDALLNVADASQMLGMSESYLYRNCDRFPFTRRVGHSLRFSKQGIQAYIAMPHRRKVRNTRS